MTTDYNLPSRGRTLFYEDFTHYVTQYPESYSIAEHWTIESGSFSSGYGPGLKTESIGEIYYNGDKLAELDEETNAMNYLFGVSVVYDANLSFILKIRRKNNENFLGLKVDFVNNKLHLLEVIANAITQQLDYDYIFESRTVPYAIGIGVYNDRFMATVHGNLAFDISVDGLNTDLKTYNRFGIEVLSVGSQVAKFDEAINYQLYKPLERSLEDAEGALAHSLYVRKRLQDLINDPDSDDWDSYNLASRMWYKTKIVNYKEDFKWQRLGYPVWGLFPERWFGN